MHSRWPTACYGLSLAPVPPYPTAVVEHHTTITGLSTAKSIADARPQYHTPHTQPIADTLPQHPSKRKKSTSYAPPVLQTA
eukprot:3679167-Rhodomonas_salina.1